MQFAVTRSEGVALRRRVPCGQGSKKGQTMRSMRFLRFALLLATACDDDATGEGPQSEPDAAMAGDASLDADTPDTPDARALDATLHDAGSHDANVDAGRDASAFDDAGYLGCYEANTIVRSRLSGEDAGLGLFSGSCVRDEDCINAPPSSDFECSGRDIKFRGCGTVIARALESDYTRWIDQLEAELCPSIRAPCNSISDCVSGVPRCIRSMCTYASPDAGSP